jgi:rhamnogalacturonyl hydrolase YesR
LDPAAYAGGEGSGTGFNCYALAWGINNKILDKKKFLPAVKSAWVGLNTLLTSEGKVGWVQPIGADPKRNFNSESWESYGAGAFLLAGSEVIKLKK